MHRLRKIAYRLLLGGLLLHLIWWVASWLVASPVLVPPQVVYSALWHMPGGRMYGHLMASLSRLAAGVVISFVLGGLSAWLMYRCRAFGRVADALVYLAYPIPKLTLLPVVMLIAGLGDTGKVVMIVLILLFQVIVHLRDGLFNIPLESFEVVRSLGAHPLQQLVHIVLPALLPDVLSALRVAIGTAISVLFVTETYGTDRGMGHFIVDAWMRLDYVEMYCGVVLLSFVGFVLFFATDLIESVACSWRGQQRD